MALPVAVCRRDSRLVYFDCCYKFHCKVLLFQLQMLANFCTRYSKIVVFIYIGKSCMRGVEPCAFNQMNLVCLCLGLNAQRKNRGKTGF